MKIQPKFERMQLSSANASLDFRLHPDKPKKSKTAAKAAAKGQKRKCKAEEEEEEEEEQKPAKRQTRSKK